MAANPTGTLILTRRDVAGLLDLERCIGAVEHAFRLHGEGRVADPAIAGVHVADGGFHVKAGVLSLGRAWFAAKTNANFMHNRERHGLPTIQGTIVLHDAETGRVLALMDSIEISILRTGAASAVAAKFLARRDSRTVAVAGCGAQGRVQLRALASVLPLASAEVWDPDPERAGAMSAELSAALGFPVRAVADFRQAARNADVVVTCTPSHAYLLGPGDIRPGTFIAAVGADNPHKREIEPGLMTAATIVVDLLEQSATIGDLHHALEAGTVTRDQVHAELGAVVAGTATGRTSPQEVTIFDSTGMALQDVAAAVAVYEAALARGVGLAIDLAG